MNTDTETLETPNQKRETLRRDWRAVIRAVIRAMERECAKAWLESAAYWRGQARKYLDNGNTDLAAEALLHAVIRETYAAEDLAKAEGGVEGHGERVLADRNQTVAASFGA